MKRTILALVLGLFVVCPLAAAEKRSGTCIGKQLAAARSTAPASIMQRGNAPAPAPKAPFREVQTTDGGCAFSCWAYGVFGSTWYRDSSPDYFWLKYDMCVISCQLKS